jgi:hypothetical protein
MQTLPGTSSGKNNKTCRIFHHESNKIEFAFFWFLYDFLRNLQESTKHKYYLRWCLHRGPGKNRDLKNMPLLCGLGLRKNWGRAMWSLGRRPARKVEFRRGPAAGLAGTGVGRSRGSLGSVLALGWGGGSAGGIARWRRPRRAAVLPAPVRLRSRQGIGRRGQLR